MPIIVFRMTDQPEITVNEGTSLLLDRQFFSGDLTDTRFSALHAPVLDYRADAWWITNLSGHPELRLKTPEPRGAKILPGAAATLPPGYSELRARHWMVGIEVTAALVLPEPPPQAAIWPTDPHSDERESAVRDFLRRNNSARLLTVARFQQYVSDPWSLPDAQPRYLLAKDVLECVPGAALVSVNQAQRDIAQRSGLTLAETGDWLVQRGLIVLADLAEIPHSAGCGHRMR